jgi:hexosaminidase
MKRGLLTIVLITILTLPGLAQIPAIIPQPVQLKVNTGHFRLNRQTTIVVAAGSGSLECKRLAALLAGMLNGPTGYHIAVSTTGKASGVIRLKLNSIQDAAIGEEGYKLKVTSANVIISANTTKGLFYGIQTLMQLLPPDIESKDKVATAKWSIPNVDITDHPRFGWRGLMLDVSRHFFPKQVVEDYIDEMAKYKFNTFHWHLADDEGWRIEIKSLPQLTNVGAWRVMRTGPLFGLGNFAPPQPGEKATYGGFYTQDEVREIIKYARDRYITILPEIDVPAHSMALIASFPNLSCTQVPYPVNAGTRYNPQQDNVLCVANDSTYLILDKIFTEIAQLFPCKYIHVGGDEAYKGFWANDPKDQALMKREGLKNVDELQSYFVKRVEQIITSKGKKLIGWDEILEGGLPSSATVMSWRGVEGGIAAAKLGHEVVMTPQQYCYLDLYQGDPSVEPHTYSKLWLRECYEYEPMPDSIDAKLILGGQGNLWTESVPDERQAQYMTWPRAMALAEVFWSPKEKGSFDVFTQRVETHFKRLDAAHIKYARSIYDPVITPVRMPGDTSLKIKLDSQIGHLDIYYTFDTTLPDNFSLKYNGVPIAIPNGAAELKVITYRNGQPIGKQIQVMLNELTKRRN